MAIPSSDIDSFSPDAMRLFYRRLYPFRSIFTWLNQQHAPTRLFTHREFAFTLPGDIYLRYNSFPNAEELKKQVCHLNPSRFEIGPMYSVRPKDRRTARQGAFFPVQRELVFDIDMTDYDPIRTCCSETAICRRCWGFISAAVHVLDTAIRDQFGYQHLLWVYSGRRGIHLWVSDKEAMELTDEERRAMVNWLTVVQGGKEPGKKVNVRIGSRALPPSLQECLQDLAEVFTDLILQDQDCFATEEGYEALLKLLPVPDVVDALRTKWSADPTRSSSEKWTDLKAQIKKSSEKATLTAALEDIILQYTYPRLDAEVSKHRNHLLKAPFVVHPGTGRVCVPVDPTSIEEFDPEKVPTVGQLLEELNHIEGKEESGDSDSDWQRTSLKPYVEMLDKHVASIMNDIRKVKLENDMSW
ncbi:prim-pol domain-containing protein [Desarmillaria tabescens]|uniref:DNA primase n=1 Tax=Armillaria tabescens TaxID=1929756 RepID=A0AA39KDG7_ARMTA|nr:prim-pol domain-containing protein [Desarmillaria tabescens]KAK0459156.1 prim-pol domain-containing protein [Desarmillaria tabescens]